jgi:sec-independent protein translocase protein TatC
VSSADIAVNRQQEREDEARTMTILEHLQELRRRLMICGIALVVAMVVSFYPITFWVLDWISLPAERRVQDFHMIFTEPLEFWMTYFRVALLVGVTLAMPVFLYQFLGFVGPGLTKNERRWAIPIVVAGSFMFVMGVLFAYYVALPPALGFLLDARGHADPFISIRKYVDFVTRLMLVTGLVFQIPFVVMGLAKIGIVTSKKLFGWWRYAIVGAFTLSAVVTPSIDPVTQTMVAVPMIVLFFLGVLLSKLVEGNPIIPRTGS